MLSFERLWDGGSDRVEIAIDTLVVAGWTGRDEAALRHHIEELAAIGVPRPSSVPVFYRVSAANLTQADAIEVLGPDTSGEAEPVLVALPDGLWLTLGSDHTDRKAETLGIALSKQLCPKVVARVLWRLDEVAVYDHRLSDTQVAAHYATTAGAPVSSWTAPSVPYQNGELDLALYGGRVPGSTAG